MLIIPRLTLLVIGLVLVLFFHAWGLLFYMLLFFLTCRFLANLQGVETFTGALKPSEEVKYFGPLLWGLILSPILVFTYFVVNAEAGVSVLPLWQRVSVVGLLPECTQPVFYDGNEIFDCDSLNGAMAVLIFLIPIVTIICLRELVAFSRSRLRIGMRKMSFIILLSGLCLIVPLLITSDITGQRYATSGAVGLPIISIQLQLVWAHLFCRITV